MHLWALTYVYVCTPVKLNKYNDNTTDMCFNSKNLKVLTFTVCRCVRQYILEIWKDVINVISEILFVNIHLEPKVFLFHL